MVFQAQSRQNKLNILKDLSFAVVFQAQSRQNKLNVLKDLSFAVVFQAQSRQNKLNVLNAQPLKIQPQLHVCASSSLADSCVHSYFACLTSGLPLRRSEVLKSLRYYLWPQSQGHHTINHLKVRGVKRGSAR